MTAEAQGRLQQQIVAVLTRMGQPATFRAFLAAIPGRSETHERTLRRAVQRLVKAGVIEIASGDGRPGDPWKYRVK